MGSRSIRGAPLRRRIFKLVVVWLLCIAAAQGRQNVASTGNATIYGMVVDRGGKAVCDATVRLETGQDSAETKTDVAGRFSFSNLAAGTYSISAREPGLRSQLVTVAISEREEEKVANLALMEDASSPEKPGSSIMPGNEKMQFSDEPSFAIAGVTDWTAVGGHGSDSVLRTSEALARETAALKPEDTKNSGDPGANANQAGEHRETGAQDELRGDPLGAVREFEEAARLDPSEESYFAWGSELLLHRAIWQAQEVFEKGLDAHPGSWRIMTGLGAALFAGARYDEAAKRLCEASDLNSKNAETYLIMGKVEIAAPDPLPCVQERLARFIEEEPESSAANYFYAMAILKGQTGISSADNISRAKQLLTKATQIDAKCADAYMELGILAATEKNPEHSIEYYSKAIAANPQLSEAHYRLGVAYDRIGQAEKAREEFALHDEIERKQAEEVERQRREIKQFVFAKPDKDSDQQPK
jgi:tetratricopeptide (TPR) repeat protein